MSSRVEHGKKTRDESGENNMLLNDLQTISKALHLDKQNPSKTLLPSPTREESGQENLLLNELQTISKALYLDKPKPSRTLLPTASSRAKASGRPPPAVEPKIKNKTVPANEDSSRKDKKSIWNWKASLRALSGVKNRKFNCCFSLQVHSIEGLPSSLDGCSLCVNWKRRDGELVTHPVKASDGTAEFEEKLVHTCLVYGSRSGPHHSAKYEAKHFLLYASIFRMPEVDLGKHRVDLTRLLPLTLEELDEEKSSGKWTTSYKLSGEAKGAVMNVSFGYTVVGETPTGNGHNVTEEVSIKRNNLKTAKATTKIGQAGGKVASRRYETPTNTSNKQSPAKPPPVEKEKDLPEVMPEKIPELEATSDLMNGRFEEDKLDGSPSENEHDKLQFPTISESGETNVESESGNAEFSIAEEGKDLPSESSTTEDLTLKDAGVSTADTDIGSKFPEVPEECINLHAEGKGDIGHKDEHFTCDSDSDDYICSKESVMKELESMLNKVSNLESEALDSSDELKTDNQVDRDESSVNPDDADSIATEFLDMLGVQHSPFGLSSESEPESPREQLLRQFEKDALAGGFSLFDYNAADWDDLESTNDGMKESGHDQSAGGFDLSSFIDDAEEDHQIGTHPKGEKIGAKMLEDFETEVLMHEWGLNDKTFECSPPRSCDGFGGQCDPSLEEPYKLPPLSEGLGPFLQTKNGGFVRSMNPSLFGSEKSGGSLIMQVSSPVVVPAEMGADVTDILEQLASVGIEKLSMQANKLMPLEDITGKTMQQIAWEVSGALEGHEGGSSFRQKLDVGNEGSYRRESTKKKLSSTGATKSSSSSTGTDIGSEYVSLDDLAPLAMDKIEALSMEGLRIQSGMSGEEAPSNISAQSAGENSSLHVKGVNVGSSLGLEGTAGMQLLDIKDNDGDIDGLMGLSLTLDEWMRLDSGDIGDGDQISERTSKILAAHHASSLEMLRGGSKGERRRGKGSGKKCGLLGNNFTVALMVQLRDPLRNYEPVGTPMLALIQVERVFIPPKPKIYCKVAELRDSKNEDEESESTSNEAKEGRVVEDKAEEEEGIPRFQISEVHVAGIKTEPEKKVWGTTTQQQAGSRWLVANGMGKNNKMKSKAGSSGDSVWSVSSRVQEKGDKWKKLGGGKQHKRNPDVNLSNKKTTSWLK
ncbi:Protein PLASTID MOVEMENT IMPAIRED 1-RELATED 1 [Linum perenne]